MSKDLGQHIELLEKVQQKLELKKMIALEKAMIGDDPTAIMKAASYIGEPKNDQGEKKFNIIDPFVFQNFLGFKDKPIMATYNLLRSMAKSPIPNAIIRTRVNQVGNFAEPQKDVYSTGFTIKKKRLPGMSMDDAKKLNKIEEAEVWNITEFLMNGGVNHGWDSVDFEQFLRSVTRDSLTFDQYTFEMVYDMKMRPHSFFATDSATIRIADSIDADFYEEIIQNVANRKPKINGYYPSFVQILDNRIIAEYYPWEMCFGVRNPTTDIYNNGYGLSEIEEMIAVITSLLWGHEYNRNIFKNGTIPKGFLRVNGNVNPNRLAEFRQMWYATMKGVMNSWRTPVLPADKAEWVDLQKSNADMEYAAWMEFNIKIACALFAIDPSEINFPLNGESGKNPMFGGSNEYKLENSKDRGLYPLLRNLQKKINKHIISLINPKYEFGFTGLDAVSVDEEQDIIVKKITHYMTINEIRAEKNLKPLPDCDTILDSTLISSAMQKEQMKMGMQQPGETSEGYEEEGVGEFGQEQEYDEEKAFEEIVLNNFNNHIKNYNKKIS